MPISSLDEAIAQLNPTLRKAHKLLADKQPREAVLTTLPLTKAFDLYAPASENGPKTFQEPMELSLHCRLAKLQEPPPDIRGVPVYALYYFMGYLYLELNDIDNAAAYLAQALLYNPASATVLFEFTECSKRCQDWKHYEQWTRNAMTVAIHAKQLARAYRNMAYVLAEQGRNADAATLLYLSMTYEKSPTALYELQYNKDQARKDFKDPGPSGYKAACKRLKIPYGPSPAVQDTARACALTLISAGRSKEAAYYTDILQELNPNRELRDLLAQAKN